MPPTSAEDWLFESTQASPGSWLTQAQRLHQAAKRLDWIPYEPSRMGVTAFATEYHFLMALSTENLIKGVVLAERLRELDPQPLKKLFNHKLVDLAKRLVTLPKPLSGIDLKVLEWQTIYIEWAGRYPLPKNQSDFVGRVHSSGAHEYERLLWERLHEHLKNIGWNSVGNPKFGTWQFKFTRDA